MGKAADPCHGPLDPETETGMGNRSILPKIEIPAEYVG